MSTHVLAYSFLVLGQAARRAAAAFETLGLSLALGEAYSPDVIEDFERDSGGSIEDIESFEESMGVSFDGEV